ncbi:MAG: hypothetical protein ACBZ72_05340 [Candidatus Bathyarchaeia archaeon]|jgi:hypothetical protein
MKYGIKLLFAAILSMSIGIACASPLLISELNLAPYPYLPEGPKPEVTANVVYASFSVQSADPALTVPSWNHNENPTTVNYNMVVNVTNLSDEYVKVDFLEASSAESFTRGGGFFVENGVSSFGGSHRYAILDGEIVNVTWIPNSGNVPTAPHPDIPGYPEYPSSVPWGIESDAAFPDEGYWREGVETSDTYVNGTLAYTYMYINGTWVDVTDRVEVPDRGDPFSTMTSGGHAIANSRYLFQAPLPEDWNSTETNTRSSTEDFGNGTTVTTTITTVTVKPMYPSGANITVDLSSPYSEHITVYTGPDKFNNTWAPNESRLIMFNGTVFAYSADVVQYLQSGNIAVHVMGQSRLTDAASVVNGTMTDTTKVIDVIQQIPVQPEGEGFVYNGVLEANQIFQPDPWDIEVFIADRS